MIVIAVDALRADFLGCYGFEGDISPNLDLLASESIVFTNCLSAAPWTKPSVASLFTSLLPQTHRVLTHRGRYGGAKKSPGENQTSTDVLPETAVTLAETLAASGYETAGFVANSWIVAAHGFGQGFDLYDDTRTGNSAPASEILNAASAWLVARESARPFFLYLHLMDVHGPYNAPEGDYTAVKASPTLGSDRQLTPTEVEAIPAGLRRARWLRGPQVTSLREWRARYAAGVRYLDRQIEPFLRDLRVGGILDNSYLVFTSDHGEEFCEHEGWAHGRTLFDDQLRVPLLVRKPNRENGGQRVSDLLSLVDLMPTVLSLTGAHTPNDVQGTDFSCLVLGERDRAALPVVAAGVKDYPDQVALIDGSFRLICDLATEGYQLYDTSADPAELDDLSSKRTDLLKRLKASLAAKREEIEKHPPLAREEVLLDPELEKQLKALGYLE